MLQHQGCQSGFMDKQQFLKQCTWLLSLVTSCYHYPRKAGHATNCFYFQCLKIFGSGLQQYKIMATLQLLWFATGPRMLPYTASDHWASSSVLPTQAISSIPGFQMESLPVVPGAVGDWTKDLLHVKEMLHYWATAFPTSLLWPGKEALAVAAIISKVVPILAFHLPCRWCLLVAQWWRQAHHLSAHYNRRMEVYATEGIVQLKLPTHFTSIQLATTTMQMPVMGGAPGADSADIFALD